jgi:hypothetical protein
MTRAAFDALIARAKQRPLRIAMSASSAAVGSGTSPQSANASRSSPAGVGSRSAMRKKDDTIATPGAGRRILSAARNVSAVVCTAPDTQPSASPARTIASAK